MTEDFMNLSSAPRRKTTGSVSMITFDPSWKDDKSGLYVGLMEMVEGLNEERTYLGCYVVGDELFRFRARTWLCPGEVTESRSPRYIPSAKIEIPGGKRQVFYTRTGWIESIRDNQQLEKYGMYHSSEGPVWLLQSKQQVLFFQETNGIPYLFIDALHEVGRRARGVFGPEVWNVSSERIQTLGKMFLPDERLRSYSTAVANQEDFAHLFDALRTLQLEGLEAKPAYARKMTFSTFLHLIEAMLNLTPRPDLLAAYASK